MNALVIDDNREMRRKIATDLQQDPFFERVVEAANGVEGIKKLSETAPDLILCDIEMPYMDGLKFLNIIRSKPETEHIPVLFLTGITDRAVKLKGLAEGAHDFIQIPYDPQELFARARLHAIAKRREEELLRRNRELELLSNKDALTGAFNRRHLCHTLNVELARAARTDGTISILMVDIDHFKQVNDTFGHQAGDHVLQRISAEIAASLRDYDLFFRYGGEEFVVLVPDTSLAGAMKVARRLCHKVRNLKFSEPFADLRVTISVGVAEYPGNDISSAEELLACADKALYQAKLDGRDQVA